MAMTTSKLLGEYLRELGSISRSQVVEGLRAQVVARDRGERRRLGEILVERGYVAPIELEVALRRQSTDCSFAA